MTSCYNLLIFIIVFSAHAAPSLKLSVVKGTTCPGGDLEYTCTASTNTTSTFSMRWIHEVGSSLTQIFYLYNEPHTLTSKTIAGFTTTASRISPNYTLTSTASLSGALLSDDNITLQCKMFIMNPPLPHAIVTEGKCMWNQLSIS